MKCSALDVLKDVGETETVIHNGEFMISLSCTIFGFFISQLHFFFWFYSVS